jgi:DNA-binding NarL/FixJ family response regulator
MTKPIQPKRTGKFRVLLVEDHPMFRDQLARIVSEEPDMEVCAFADNVAEAVEQVGKNSPDFAIVDITLKGPGGIEFLKELRSRGIDLPTLVLSMHQESLYAERVLQAGGRGFISKSQPASELKRAIRQVLGGEVYLSPEMTSSLLKRMASGGKSAGELGIESLTDRELEIFQLLGAGQNIPAIAKTLNLADSTIETYRARIREKLGVASAAQLYSIAAGWLKDQGV